MQKSVKRLLKHRHNYFSQSGEDGVLSYIISRLPEKTGWCVEFGAWNGLHLSNTYHLVSQLGYKSVLIEGDIDRAKELTFAMRQFHGCYCINTFVQPEGPDCLDQILARIPIPNNFDLLSIDIDGNDYYIWQSLHHYLPAVVIIEINIRDKPHVERIHPLGTPLVWGQAGTSIRSMTNLARRKGYALLANVGCNVIFVRSALLPLFHDHELQPENVFLFEGHKLYELNCREAWQLGVTTTFIWMVKKVYQKIAFWRTDWEKNK